MAAPKRFFVDSVGGEEIVLTGDTYSHVRNVLRLREGDEIVLLDNSGKEYDAVIRACGKGFVTCSVLSERVSDKECRTDIALFAGFLKGDRTEFVVQKATELGVREIGLFTSRYCSAYPSENKLARLRKVAFEAAQQCLRSVAPDVRLYDFSGAVRAADRYENKIFACEFAEKSETEIRGLRGSCALMVGSEGGFSREEFEEARRCGWAGVSLGKRILRAETAAVALTAITAYCLGEME